MAAVLPVVNAQGSYTHQFLAPIRATLAGLAGSPPYQPADHHPRSPSPLRPRTSSAWAAPSLGPR